MHDFFFLFLFFFFEEGRKGRRVLFFILYPRKGDLIIFFFLPFFFFIKKEGRKKETVIFFGHLVVTHVNATNQAVNAVLLDESQYHPLMAFMTIVLSNNQYSDAPCQSGTVSKHQCPGEVWK